MTLNKKVFISLSTAMLTLAFAFLFVAEGVHGQQAEQRTRSTLENVRAYVAAVTSTADSYAVDQGHLYAGNPGAWRQVKTPDDVIVNAVAVDSQRPQTIVIGTGDRSLLYISRDMGASWQKVPLESDTPSGVTALAIDSTNRLIYAGTFTNGVYRLRDVGSSVIAAGHLLLDEPVAQIIADSGGSGRAFVRTEWNLYRAEESGLAWFAVENLPSPATAIAMAGTPAALYVGTANSGIVKSMDGVSWQSVNTQLPYTPGSQLYISALAADPLQPDVLYAAINLIFGSANAHITPVNVAISQDGGTSWQTVGDGLDALLTDLMPVSGQTGMVYGLSERSRSLLALGDSPRPTVVLPVEKSIAPVQTNPWQRLTLMAWVIAGLATTALALLVAVEVYREFRQPQTEVAGRAAHYSQRQRLQVSDL